MINRHYYGQDSGAGNRRELDKMKRLLATMKRQTDRQPMKVNE
jgi:hypothetical protein